MANASKPNTNAVSLAYCDLNDGTNARALSPLAGPLRRIPSSPPILIPDMVAHYDVKAGDSLWSISAHLLGNGCCMRDLASLNRMGAQDELQVGQRLIVPDYRRCDLTAAYMLSEMKTNAQSSEAAAIAKAISNRKSFEKTGNEAIEDLKKTKWYDILRQYADQTTSESMMDLQNSAALEVNARWFLMVRAGGPWDHKPKLKEKYDNMPSPPRSFGSMGKAYHFPIRNDLFHEYYYDIWSNIHYGYVGTRCGFDEATLQTGAASNLPGVGSNDEGDVISVAIGVRLWNSHGLDITAQHLLESITANAENYKSARLREIKNGIPEEKATNVVISNNDYK